MLKLVVRTGLCWPGGGFWIRKCTILLDRKHGAKLEWEGALFFFM